MGTGHRNAGPETRPASAPHCFARSARRRSQSGSFTSRSATSFGWSIMLRPNWSEPLATPFGLRSFFDIKRIFGVSIPLHAITNNLRSRDDSASGVEVMDGLAATSDAGLDAINDRVRDDAAAFGFDLRQCRRRIVLGADRADRYAIVVAPAWGSSVISDAAVACLSRLDVLQPDPCKGLGHALVAGAERHGPIE